MRASARVLAAAASALLFMSTAACPLLAAGAPGDGRAVLDTHSGWRCYFVWGTELVQWKSGEITSFRMVRKKGLERVDGEVKLSAPPPARWASPDFDDRDWVLSPGPIQHAPYRQDLAVAYLRGRFEVPDPAATGGLTLALSYRGGVVVYLNGKEVARNHLPGGHPSPRLRRPPSEASAKEGGQIAPETLAEGYPRDAYVDAAGTLLFFLGRKGEEPPAGMRLRVRTLSVEVPARELRKGVNVLAVEVHRAPAAEIYYTAKRPKKGYHWSMLGFDDLRLEAKAGSLPGAGAVRPGSLRVWPGNPLVDAWDTDGGEPGETTAAVSLVAARNGAFTAVVMVRSAGELNGLKVGVGDLAHIEGKGTIPARGCLLRYALPGASPPDLSRRRREKGERYLGVLAESPPAQASVPPGEGGVTVPVWVTVRVAREAAPGEYRGAFRVSARGAARVELPVRMWVADYALPSPKEFASFTGIMESPESVALQYGVKLWSEEHWKHLERIFALLGQVGVKSVFIPLVAQTNQGNAESMVRYVKQADGSYRHDFSAVERYLDLTVKHLGAVPAVCLYVWTPAHGGGSWGKTPDKAKNARPMVFTEVDPATGEAKTSQGPDWGAPESRPFWRPVFEGLSARLAERGLKGSAALGLLCDFNPGKQTVEDMAAVAPDLKWMIHAHGLTRKFAGRPTFLAAHVWGTKGPFVSTYRRHKYGWRNKIITTVFPRYGAGSMGHVRRDSPIGVYHALIECYQASGYNGVSRMGADFWPVLQGRRGKTSVTSRYSYRNRPGAPTMCNGSFLFPAKDGAVATVRFEALRLGVQETEARIFIEKALAEEGKRARLGEELAERAQALLDERVRGIMRAKRDRSTMYSMGSDASWLGYAQGRKERARRLFATAAEVAKKLGE